MTFNGWVQIALYFAVLTALVVPLGRYMARVFAGETTFLSPVLRPLETRLYRAAGVNEAREQHWTTYTLAMLMFNAAGFVLLYALLRLQGWLPLNPEGMPGVPADLAFNTAVSVATNTNWQNYAPVDATTLEGASQVISQGPAASQIAIPSSPRFPTRPRRAAPSSCLPRRSTASGGAT